MRIARAAAARTSLAHSTAAPQTDSPPRFASQNSLCATALLAATRARPHYWLARPPPHGWPSTALPTAPADPGSSRQSWGRDYPLPHAATPASPAALV